MRRAALLSIAAFAFVLLLQYQLIFWGKRWVKFIRRNGHYEKAPLHRSRSVQAPPDLFPSGRISRLDVGAHFSNDFLLRHVATCEHLSADRKSLLLLGKAKVTGGSIFSPGANPKLRLSLAGGREAIFRYGRCTTYNPLCGNFVAELLSYHVAALFGQVAKVPPTVLRALHLTRLCEIVPDSCAHMRRAAGGASTLLGSLQLVWNNVSAFPRHPHQRPPQNWCHGPSNSSEGDRYWAEWADLLLFDYLTDNTDRLVRGKNLFWRTIDKNLEALVWLDNTAAFAGLLAANNARLLCNVCDFPSESIATLRRIGDLGDALKLSLDNCEVWHPVRLFPQMKQQEMDIVFDALTKRQRYFLSKHLSSCAHTER
eukprot:TRINITY_DN55346_c0_g1_i1.p1 TRINITY_DN55346_c0_g1~~TRINITY_DN55346_c0_g1_i1.p1  ORF type:complete len:369 (-),score=39.39 TRINITY_DN55346_c0_g1_i1:3-1109(-)